MEKAKGKRWLAVSPVATDWQAIPPEDGAPEFEVGFWPPAIAEKLEVLLLAVLRRSKSDISKPVAEETIAEEIQSSKVGLEYQRLAVKFGVRGWRGVDLASPPLEMVEIDGRKYPALPDDALDVFYHEKVEIESDGKPVSMRFLPLLATAARIFNTLTEEQKKTLASRRNSPAAETSGTSAPAATS